MLERVENLRLSHQAAEQIKKLILTRELKAGDKLPGERQLVMDLGVSRSVAREALRALEAAGLVTVHPGRGAYVRSVGEDVLTKPFAMWVQYQPDIMADLMEARRTVESEIAALAAMRSTDEDIARLRQTHARMSAVMHHGDLFEIAAMDVDFHQALAEAGRNRVLLQILISLSEPLFKSRLISLSLPERRPLVLQRHQVILEAVSSRNPEAARTAMRLHLQTAADEVTGEFPHLRKAPGSGE